MNTDMQLIWEGKRAFRRSLAERPVAEKLAMLDALRERACEIRKASKSHGRIAERESIREYTTGIRLRSSRCK